MTPHLTAGRNGQILSLVIMCHKAREQEAYETESWFVDLPKVTRLLLDSGDCSKRGPSSADSELPKTLGWKMFSVIFTPF